MRTRNDTNRWCILRTAAPSTLRLAASLNAAGIEAWTPEERVKWRRPRGGPTETRPAPIVPTFVFVRERHLINLQRIERVLGGPHPRFSIFRYYGDTVFVRHSALHPLRAQQQDGYLASLPKRHGYTKERGEAYDAGDRVKLTTGPFTGFECVVESSDGLWTTLALTLFGRHAGLQVATRQLRTDRVQVV